MKKRREKDPLDWARIAQCAGVFIRQLRGDSEREIAADSERELERGRQMKRVATEAARNAMGCTRSRLCTCPVCSVEPIQHTQPGVDQRN